MFSVAAGFGVLSALGFLLIREPEAALFRYQKPVSMVLPGIQTILRLTVMKHSAQSGKALVTVTAANFPPHEQRSFSEAVLLMPGSCLSVKGPELMRMPAESLLSVRQGGF